MEAHGASGRDDALDVDPRSPATHAGDRWSQWPDFAVTIKKQRSSRAALPAFLWRFFWEVDAKQVSVRKNRGYVVQRLVSVGDQTAIDWLRAEVGDACIRKEIIACRGRGFTAAQVAPWISGPQYAAWNAEDSNRALWVPG